MEELFEKFNSNSQHGRDAEALFESLQKFQVSCPWGELEENGGDDGYLLDPIPYVPIGLVVGCGETASVKQYQKLAVVNKFGKLIFTDILICGKTYHGAEYSHLDLNDPASIHMGGNQVHMIMSSGVFSYDGWGVSFKNREIEYQTAAALAKLLMPGGIMVNDNFTSSQRFEEILIENFGLKQVRGNSSSVIVLQKPFNDKLCG